MARNILLDPGLWFSVGCRRRPGGWIGRLISPFAAAVAIYVDLRRDLYHHRPMGAHRRVPGGHDGTRLPDGGRELQIPTPSGCRGTMSCCRC